MEQYINSFGLTQIMCIDPINLPFHDMIRQLLQLLIRSHLILIEILGRKLILDPRQHFVDLRFKSQLLALPLSQRVILGWHFLNLSKVQVLQLRLGQIDHSIDPFVLIELVAPNFARVRA